MDEKSLKNAQRVFETAVKALDANKWHYDRDDAKLKLKFEVCGDDLPMQFTLEVDAQRQLLKLFSVFSYRMSEKSRINGALATSYANHCLADGSFDYDVESGMIAYRMTSSFRDSIISEKVIHYLIGFSCTAVDEYNDKFLMISTEAMTLDDFVNSIQNSDK